MAPVHGQLAVSGDGMRVTFTCDVGYTLVGNDTSECLSAGAGWNTTTPECGRCRNIIENMLE